MSWEKMIRPKSHGGIGFRGLWVFNKALLARQAWRLIQNPEILCARLLMAKYFPNSNLARHGFCPKSIAVMARSDAWIRASKTRCYLEDWIRITCEDMV
jgi:hypothetical protein